MARLAITVDGIVQGVGFRPFVYGLASQWKLAGFVRNLGGRVEIEAEGTQTNLDRFCKMLSANAPPLAKIERVSCQKREPRGETGFHIHNSEPVCEPSDNPIFISPDVATCDECLLDLFDPWNRRYLYPFVNCTNCGPRLTIIQGAPYDRARTTMAGFEMCADCRAEYENPTDRRFHAQPTCCPKCGPRVELLESDGRRISTANPINALATALAVGKIAAIKGLGGYHLACDARNESAVAELRRRKHRDEKPFAVMVRDLAGARNLCEVDAAEVELLRSTHRPIVLLRKRDGNDLASMIAPKNARLGIMLPYTPLHHLLMREVDAMPLVLTSGNSSDEPIAYEDADAIERLGSIADLFLIHNRPIHIRCDDSVTRIVDGVESPIRRSRGYAPQPIRLPISSEVSTLAVGGQLKATFALGHGHHAFISQHMGDLDHFEASQAFERDVALYEKLFEIQPVQIAHDLHPDYVSTLYARRLAGWSSRNNNACVDFDPRSREVATQASQLRLIAIQHHHAHMASCMAENALDEPVIGVTFDGTGFGTDGTIWGGEFLVGDYREFRRAAHLRYVGMPGADKAIREPWRMAVSYLADAERDESSLVSRTDASSLRIVCAMLAKGFNTPVTSSAGRLFDAVASLMGIRDTVSYEGQAAIEMEQLATATASGGSYAFELSDDPTIVIDTRPIIHGVLGDLSHGTELAGMARRFHSTVVEMIASVCQRISKSTGITSVALSGGVFLNALLTSETVSRLRKDGYAVYRHRLVPPNDGGLCLGQLAIAAARTSHQPSKLETLCASPFQAK